MQLFVILLCGAIRIILAIFNPIVSAKVIVSLTQSEYERIIYFAIALLIMDLIICFARYLARITAGKLYRVSLANIGIDLSKNVLKLENSILDEKGSGVFIQRLTNDTSKIADAFQLLIGMITDLIKYIGILIAVFIINKIFFVIIFIMYAILVVIETTRVRRKNADDKKVRKLNERVTGFIGELVRGARDIKMLNSEDDFIEELSGRINEAHEKKYFMQKRSWNLRIFSWELSTVFDFIIIILLVIFMKGDLLIPTTALVIFNYYNRCYGCVFFFGDFLEYVKDFNLSSQRVRAIIESDEFRKEKFGSKHLDKINGDFEFKNVTFGYKNKKVLKNLSFKVKANETVAFVGKSGAGKTTIFSLLCKMYDVKNGEITIDGININELDKDSIRGNITIISQDPYIFNMSIKDNLRLVKSDVTLKEMKEACKAACLDGFVSELPDGYDTLIGEGGVNLSGGQKQRLAIARALIQKTEIILLDEATSALDNETQEKITMAIENMKDEYTILIIAHRLSTIINANKILYLNNGKIEAQGTHQELLENCENYRKLYDTELNNVSIGE